MKKKRIIILLLQIILIVISVFLLIGYTQQQIRPTEVFVYNVDMDDSSIPLTIENVKKVTIPVKAITKDFALKEEDIIGKHIDSKVRKGQYVYKSQLIEKEEVDIFSIMDLSKYRKISLPITLIDGFAGNIKKGDKVDLVYTGEGNLQNDNASGEKFRYSKVFMQDVLVYSINTSDGYRFIDQSNRTVNDINKDEVEKNKSNGKQKIETITLAVTLEQAEEIEARTNTGIVRFLGRFNDSKSYNTLGYVLGDYQKIFSGQGFAETDNIFIEEDDFDYIEESDNETEEDKEDKQDKQDDGFTEYKEEKTGDN